MPLCTVKGCKNRSSGKNRQQEELEKKTKITFHMFPKCPIRRQLWQNSIGLENSILPKYATVCSVHFKPEDFDRTSLSCVRLKTDAVPSVKFPEDTKENIINECIEVSTQKASSSSLRLLLTQVGSDNSPAFSESSKSPTGNTKYSENTAFSDEPMEKVSKIEFPSQNKCLYTLLQTADKSTQVEISSVHKSTCVSPKRLFHSPRKEALRKYISIMKKKHESQLKILNKKNKRNENKVASLKTILQLIKRKKLLQDEEIETLSGISDFNNQLFLRMKKKSCNQSVKRTYNPELRLFSLTLHYYSPRSYSYVRQKFNSCLPHPKTLYRWYQSIDGEPGFNTEAVRHIKSYFETVQERLFATLVIDEMAIRQQIEFDGKKFTGFVDVGKAFLCNEQSVAKEALVFLLVGLNKSWKIPVGYFLIEKINGEQKANLVKQCLKIMHNTGVQIVCLTCDGASSNVGMAKELGCNFSNIHSLQTSFLHPVTRQNIYFMFDPCHMVKLIRNTFGDFKCFVNGRREKIMWKYIENLHELQEREGLHLGNKLTKQHVQYGNKKMKVKLAVQVLSSSVCKAMYMCRKNLQLEQFNHSEATEEFVELINDLFDIFNSRNMRQKYFKTPINPENYYNVIEKFNYFEQYVTNLSFENGKKVIESQRKMGFLGFLICIQSLKNLYKDICLTKEVTHIPLYQCSQDHLELFFCCLRSLGGNNNNPSVRQFKTGFKKLLLHNEIKSSESANCTALYNIPVLYYSSTTSTEIINATTSETTHTEIEQKQKQEIEDWHNVIEYHSYSRTDTENLYVHTEFSSVIIAYIAGYIVKHLEISLHCSVCVAALHANNINHCIYNLIKVKDRGSLKYASYDVYKICREAEKYVKLDSLRNSINSKTVPYTCTKILHELNIHNLFITLRQHTNDQIGLFDHKIHLIKSIIQQYVKIRFNYISKQYNIVKSKRTLFNKLVLFSGQ